MRARPRQGGWTVLDQALFSGSNFVVNVLLARWLAPEAFGAFTTAFVVFLVCGTLHAGLLVEPMLVFGAGRFERRRRAYLRLLVLGHAGFAAGVGSVFGLGALAALALGRPFVASVVGALGVAQSGILLLWMARRACLVAHKPTMAAAGGAGYLPLLVGSAVAMQTAGLLTAATSLLLMAGVSAAVAGVLLARLGVPLRRPTPDTPAFRAEVLRAHWTYGRWSMPTGVLEWIVSTMPFLVVPLVVGVEGNALLRALLNLALPALQAFVAIAAFSLPVLVRARAAGHMPRTMRRFGALALAGALSYALLLGGLGEWALDLLYGGKYIATPAELWLLAGYPVAVGLGGVFTASLRARERPRSVFWARVGAVVLGAPTTAAMAMQWGVAGGLAGGLITLSLEAVALALSARASDPRPAVRVERPAAAARAHGRVRVRPRARLGVRPGLALRRGRSGRQRRLGADVRRAGGRGAPRHRHGRRCRACASPRSRTRSSARATRSAASRAGCSPSRSTTTSGRWPPSARRGACTARSGSTSCTT